MESNHWCRKQGPTLHTAQAVLSCIPAYVWHYRSTRALISLLAVTVPTAFLQQASDRRWYRPRLMHRRSAYIAKMAPTPQQRIHSNPAV